MVTRYRLATAALALAASTPAFAEPFGPAPSATVIAAKRYETAFLATAAIDAIQTDICLHRGTCEEGNFILGKNPGRLKQFGTTLLGGAIHYAVFRYTLDRDPKLALRLAQISLVGEGANVLLNFRFTFK